MPIKIFVAPGDHRDDFEHVENQFNTWEAEKKPNVTSLHTDVVVTSVKRHELGQTMTAEREVGQFMMSLVVYYENT